MFLTCGEQPFAHASSDSWSHGSYYPQTYRIIQLHSLCSLHPLGLSIQERRRFLSDIRSFTSLCFMYFRNSERILSRWCCCHGCGCRKTNKTGEQVPVNSALKQRGDEFLLVHLLFKSFHPMPPTSKRERVSAVHLPCSPLVSTPCV